MPVIDAQVHAYERDRPERPWAAVLHGPDEVTGDQMVAAMDQVGVDGALLVSPWTMYRYDPSYALEVHAEHPDRFGLITPIDVRRDDIDDAVAAWADNDGAVGVRLVLWGARGVDATHPGVGRVVAAAGRHGLPVCVLSWEDPGIAGRIAAAHPDTRLVVDHLGLMQPFEPPPPDEPFARLDEVLALAVHDNLAVKVTGVCTLSHAGPPTFDDLWEPLGRVFDAFGFDRLMWGTDWTRATAVVSYADAVAAFAETDRLSDDERSQLMGGTVERIFGWSPSGRAASG